jgi:cardiolipin synthase
MLTTVETLRPIIVAVLSGVLAVIASAHAILHKRDTRAAVAWVGLIWLVPVLGALLYLLLGINRIHRRATELRKLGIDVRFAIRDTITDWQVVSADLSGSQGQLEALARVVGRVTTRAPLPGNRLVPLVNGDEAYPEMLEAIERAERSIALGTYIFDQDDAGTAFADALERAVRRSVQVRVLIDAIGVRYSFPSMVRELRRRGVRIARFMHSWLPWRIPFANLRSHRKFLIADGAVGFTGGMNIRAGHVLSAKPKRPVQDLHFRIEGPVVGHLMEVFAEDWAFTTREVLRGDDWFPILHEAGSVVARGISDGPGADFDKLRLTLHGAIAAARSKICVVTPYFLPDRELIAALNIAAMRGVEVQIVLPEVSNQPVVAWASTAQHWQLLERGCRIFLTPPPFDHTKLMIVDRTWTLIGSANWDPRSLRLNFEFNVECYDEALATEMELLVEHKLRGARELTKAEVDARRLLIQLRDGTARLFSPYI